MPKVTVYVREEDLPSWKDIEKKTEFIHDALLVRKGLKQFPTDRPVTVINEPEKILEKIKKTAVGGSLCRLHGTPLDNRGRCMIKGCKYA